MSVGRFFGYIFCGLGVLVMLLSGGCSLFVVIAAFGNVTMDLLRGSLSDISGLSKGAGMVLLFGGLPFLVGLGIYKFGAFCLRHHAVSQEEDDRDA